MGIENFDSLERITAILGELSPTKDPYYEVFDNYVKRCESKYKVSNGFLINDSENMVGSAEQDLYKLAFEYVALKDQFGEDFVKFQELANKHFEGDILKIIAIRLDQKIPMSVGYPTMYLQFLDRKIVLNETQKNHQFVGFEAYLHDYLRSK